MLQSLCDILNDAFREARDRSPERFLEAVDAYADAVVLAESGLFASFVYEALEAEGNATVAALADISTGRAYAVEGSQLTDCPEWAGSVVTGRIARTADGSWHAVSPFFYRDRAPLEVGLRVAADIRDSRPAGTPLSMAFAQEILGDGPLADSLRVSGAPGL